MKSFKIFGAEIIGNGLKIDDTLIISDLHFGYETSLNRQGFMIPRFQYDEIVESIEKIHDRASASTIILNGDIKHNFGSIDKQEWREVLGFIDYLSDTYSSIRVVRGNHDNFTQYILDKRDILMEDEIVLDNYLITHGHNLPSDVEESVDTIIIGHEHPCIGIRNNERVEKVKCFLKGCWDEYNLIVEPSFTTVSYGCDVLHEKTMSPFIGDVGCFEVYAVEEYNVYPFGLVNDILSVEDSTWSGSYERI